MSVVVDGEIELVSEPSGVPSVRVTHLPNLTLYVRYPDDYPSQSCPVFHLSARWLSSNQKHMASLRKNLEALYTPGWPVVFEWISYLSNELAGEYCKLQQNDTPDVGTSSKLFVRSMSQGADIVAHDEYQKHQLFLQDTHECVICCEMKQGKLFSERCQSCKNDGGLCCRDCLAHYCQVMNCLSHSPNHLYTHSVIYSTICCTLYRHLFRKASMLKSPALILAVLLCFPTY